MHLLSPPLLPELFPVFDVSCLLSDFCCRLVDMLVVQDLPAAQALLCLHYLQLHARTNLLVFRQLS